MSERYKDFDEDFEKFFNLIQAQAHGIALGKGWWEEPRSDAECIALMHSELSEALEGLRNGNTLSDKIPAFLAVEEELADVIIRIMDFADKKQLRVSQALLAKLDYNMSRPHKHGKKF